MITRSNNGRFAQKITTIVTKHGKHVRRPFNWLAFLGRTNISDDEWEQASSLACSWTTCACGHLCDAIPRSKAGGNRPVDGTLSFLGQQFYDAMKMRNVKYGKQLLGLIEIRAAQVLKGDAPHDRGYHIEPQYLD